ncbi:MAG TPA: 1-deoxy-D-xylulose-5-phosphate reductoisomerase [Phycisphaerae bacterium]
MKQRIVILGSTGSIGGSALHVLAGLRETHTVVGLAAQSRWAALAAQANQWAPEFVAITDAGCADELGRALKVQTHVLTGADALVKLVEASDCDCVVSAIVGVAGLPATLRAIELGKRVALANKEALVVGGALLMPLARRSGAQLIPVDSEHSAVFQAMQAGKRSEVRRIFLTASGGPFRTWDADRMHDATLDDALNHPTWNMGPKISIDSATMMNKALEIIEARWLFDLSPDQIEVVIHPESIVHALVEFCDGALVAQVGSPDMRTPIQYALTYPDRRTCPSRPLDFCALRELHFEPPDPIRFPAIELGHEAARAGGAAGAVLNAANEAAVELFRAGALRFTEIVEVTRQIVERAPGRAMRVEGQSLTLAELLAADRWAREQVQSSVMAGEWSGSIPALSAAKLSQS